MCSYHSMHRVCNTLSVFASINVASLVSACLKHAVRLVSNPEMEGVSGQCHTTEIAQQAYRLIASVSNNQLAVFFPNLDYIFFI